MRQGNKAQGSSCLPEIMQTLTQAQEGHLSSVTTVLYCLSKDSWPPTLGFPVCRLNQLLKGNTQTKDTASVLSLHRFCSYHFPHYTV